VRLSLILPTIMSNQGADSSSSRKRNISQVQGSHFRNDDIVRSVYHFVNASGQVCSQITTVSMGESQNQLRASTSLNYSTQSQVGSNREMQPDFGNSTAHDCNGDEGGTPAETSTIVDLEEDSDLPEGLGGPVDNLIKKHPIWPSVCFMFTTSWPRN